VHADIRADIEHEVAGLCDWLEEFDLRAMRLAVMVERPADEFVGCVVEESPVAAEFQTQRAVSEERLGDRHRV
jgi:hypothetical protein